jgi:hypothetical protein
MKGDGCEWRGKCPKDQYVTVSKTLAYHVQMLFHQMGRPASIRAAYRPEGATTLFQGRPTAVRTQYAVVSHLRKYATGNRAKMHCGKYRMTTRVRSVDFVEDWSGTVYNIEVDRDHSYTANGRIVHNCEFVDMVGAVFRQEDVERAFDNDLEPLFEGA